MLAIDYGQKRVGLARSDIEGLLAYGLPTLEVNSASRRPEVLAQTLLQTALANQVKTVVLGLPKQLSGHLGESAQKVLALAEALYPLLQAQTPAMALFLVDERLSSVIAHQQLHAVGKAPSKNKALVDQRVACGLIETFWQQCQHQPPQPFYPTGF